MPDVVISVDEIKSIQKGSLRAFAIITIAGKLTIHGIRVIQQEGQTAWVSMPQTEVKSTTGGKSKYFPIVEVSDEKLKQQISDAVLSAWQAQ